MNLQNWRGRGVMLLLGLAVWMGLQLAHAQPSPKAAKRVALVMGNDAYTSVSKLQKAGNDATAMARELRAAGFDVTLARDLNYRAMVRAVDAFTSKLGGGEQVVVFFAGHGVQIRAGSYLLPVDIEAASEGEIEKTAYGLNELTEKLAGAKAAFTLVLVDACRDNPLRGNTGRSVGASRGLAAIEPPRGQMVVYSASRGQQALDRLNDKDANPNGVFTREFIARMRQPGLRIEDMVRDVQDSVETLAKTVNHDQRPAIYNESRGEFYFFAPAAVQATARSEAPVARLAAPVQAIPLPVAAPAIDADVLAPLRKAAEAGDQVAMLSLGDKFAAGEGVARDAREADNWYLKAAAEGNVLAEFKLSVSYRNSDPAFQADVVKILAQPVENRRNVSAGSKELIRQLVETDPFFDVPTGAGKVNFTYKTNTRDHMEGYYLMPPSDYNASCSRAGRLAQREYNYVQVIDLEGSSQDVLGGLLPLTSKTKYSMFQSYATEVLQVDSLHGQPFPLKPGKRFGMSYRRLGEHAGKETTSQTLSCMADTAQPVGSEGTQVLCLYQNNKERGRYFLARYLWNEASGCFVQRYESAGGGR